jgi:hypothetical protein
MYQKDFILRMIEMMGDLIAAILGKIKNGKLEQAALAIENAYYDFLKEDAGFFRGLPKEKLTEDLIKKHNYTNGHLEILAGLFFAEAELLDAEGNYSKSLETYEKALLLYIFVDNGTKTFSFDTESRILLIKKQIQQLKVRK